MTKFEVGKTYACRSLADYDCIYTFTILARTEKTITTKVRGVIVKRRVRPLRGETVEQFTPFGAFSLCPIVHADIRSRRLAESATPDRRLP